MKKEKKESKILDFFYRKIKNSPFYRNFVKQQEVNNDEWEEDWSKIEAQSEEDVPFVSIPFEQRAEIIDELEKIDDEQEIVDFLKERRIRPSNFDSGNLHDVLVTFYPNRYDELYDKITERIKIYWENYACDKEKERRSEIAKKRLTTLKKKRKKDLPFAHNVVAGFVTSSDRKIKNFCSNENIDIKKFSKCVGLVREFDSDLYAMYSDKIGAIQKQRYAMIIGQVNEIVRYIKDGIVMENGERRNFDIVDYYMIQKYNVPSFDKISKEVLNQSDYSCLKRFFTKNKLDEKTVPLNIKMTLSEVSEVNCNKDKNGNLVSGTGRIVTEEEKLSIMDYLRKNGVPLTPRTYGVAFRRYLKNQLFNGIDKRKNNGNR